MPEKSVTFVPLYVESGVQARFDSLVAVVEALDGEQKSRAREELMRFVKVQNEAPLEYNAVLNQIIEGRDVERADVKARQVLEQMEGTPLHPVAAQMIGNNMLKRHLLRTSNSTEVEEAIAFYTQKLLENHHPDAAVLADALARLEGSWTVARRKEAARQALGDAEAYLARTGGAVCDGVECASKTGAQAAMSEDEQREIATLRRGVMRLQQLSR